MRQEGKIIAHHIDNKGQRHQQNTNPKPPIAVSTFPVWTGIILAALVQVVLSFVRMALTECSWTCSAGSLTSND